MRNKTTKKCKSCKELKSVKEFYSQYKSAHPNWNCYDSYCIPCRLIYGNDRRRMFKKMAVEYKGGECIDCQFRTTYYCIYDFHHIGHNKEFNISSYSKTWETLKTELDKCILLCSNCHRVRHSANNIYEKIKKTEKNPQML